MNAARPAPRHGWACCIYEPDGISLHRCHKFGNRAGALRKANAIRHELEGWGQFPTVEVLPYFDPIEQVPR